MSTHFLGEGNIGSSPEFLEFSNGNEEPRRLLKMNVYFDNPVPKGDGYDDRGGYWAPVELWHKEAESWSTLFQKGMRILVEGRTVLDRWEDDEQTAQSTFKIEARKVGIMPHRLQSITLKPKSESSQTPSPAPASDESDESAGAAE